MTAPRPPARIAVVIPSVNGFEMLRECLAALEPEACTDEVVVVVVDRCGPRLRGQVAREFPWVEVLEADAGESIPALRDRGIRHVRASVVAILEDHCLVAPGWLQEVRDAWSDLDDGCAAVGGPVENGAVDRLVDWASFLCEYSHAMGPMAPGESQGVPGNNVAYRRSALETLGPERAEKWEYFLHAELARAGYRFVFRPAMVVYHKRPFGFWEYVQQRFLYSRSFAAMRGSQTGPGGRTALALASLALPPVLLWRIARQAVGKRRHVGKLVLSLPLLLVFTTSWAAGEFAGYLLGDGGSLAKVT